MTRVKIVATVMVIRMGAFAMKTEKIIKEVTYTCNGCEAQVIIDMRVGDEYDAVIVSDWTFLKRTTKSITDELHLCVECTKSFDELINTERRVPHFG